MKNKQQINILDSLILETIRTYVEIPAAELAHTCMGHPLLMSLINEELNTSYDRAFGWSSWDGTRLMPVSQQPAYALISRRLKALKMKGIITTIPNGWSRQGGSRRVTNWIMA